MAVHMGTNLKTLCTIAHRMVVLKRNNVPLIKIPVDHEKLGKLKTEILELKELFANTWNSEISSIAMKHLRENK